MSLFLKKNKNKKIVILDIPLLLENKINKKNDILIFVQSKKNDIFKRLIKRKNYNKKLVSIFRNIQLPLDYKKKQSQFIIKNNFSNKSVSKDVKKIIKEIYK
jgi:dephospho-CoA kinase